MRMWMVPTEIMCRNHLLGEHLEIHMFVGCLKKGKSLKGYIDKGLVEISHILTRHHYLVEEMKRRGYNHKTPIGDYPIDIDNNGNVDIEKSLKDLLSRCENCRERNTALIEQQC